MAAPTFPDPSPTRARSRPVRGAVAGANRSGQGATPPRAGWPRFGCCCLWTRPWPFC